jgi:hypothetical protein
VVRFLLLDGRKSVDKDGVPPGVNEIDDVGTNARALPT